MLSILIPIYNWDVVQLTLDLCGQCRAAGIAFEIRCYEDGSAPDQRRKNQSLAEMEGVVYRVYEKNQGRSRIRNLLAGDARYPFLLFLDGDSGIVRADFIERYTALVREDAVLYGGRVYPDQRPADHRLHLHWQYGRQRETAAAEQRRRRPYDRFMTNNFLIPKSVFSLFGFDERLLQYGHEDTLFGQQLRDAQVPIIHLDNPVEHLGLEPAGVFLEKNRQAMQNLSFLHRRYPGLDTQLLTLVRRLRPGRWEGAVWFALRTLLPLVRRNLLSRRPRLRALDLFKLYYFLYYDRK